MEIKLTLTATNWIAILIIISVITASSATMIVPQNTLDNLAIFKGLLVLISTCTGLLSITATIILVAEASTEMIISKSKGR